MARDRSPEAVARAFLATSGLRQHYADGCTACVREIATLIRAVRRECARVARGSSAITVGEKMMREVIARNIAALNRAPRGGRRG